MYAMFGLLMIVSQSTCDLISERSAVESGHISFIAAFYLVFFLCQIEIRFIFGKLLG